MTDNEFQVIMPSRRYHIIMDEAGRNLSADVFFSLTHKKYYSFLEFSNAIAIGEVLLETDIIFICVGIGYVFKQTSADVKNTLEHLMQTIYFLRPSAQLYISTLWPNYNRFSETSVALLKYNKAIAQTVLKWQEQGCDAFLVETHKIFVSEVSYLCAETGVLMENYQLVDEARKLYNSTASAIGVKGWYLVRKLWLSEIGNKPASPRQDSSVSEYYTSAEGSRDSGINASSTSVSSTSSAGEANMQDLSNLPIELWLSPKARI